MERIARAIRHITEDYVIVIGKDKTRSEEEAWSITLVGKQPKEGKPRVLTTCVELGDPVEENEEGVKRVEALLGSLFVEAFNDLLNRVLE